MSDLSEGQSHLRHWDDRVCELGRLLAALRWDITLHRLAEEIPDARARLGYLAQMTDGAANKVLNLVDEAQPRCEAAATEAAALSGRLALLADHPDLGVGEARALLAEAADALAHQAAVNRHRAGLLSQIMLAQDFQDLSGQVIKKVVGILDHAEQQLQQLLSQSEGPEAAAPAPSRLEGPQVPDKAVVQEDVDGLLATLGF